MKTLTFKTEWSSKLVLGLGLAMLTFFSSCEKDDADTTLVADATIDEATIESEAVAQADYEELDEIAVNIMGLAEGTSGGRIDGATDERCHHQTPSPRQLDLAKRQGY